MALISCPECGRSISNAAQACPQCGFPVNAIQGQKAMSAPQLGPSQQQGSETLLMHAPFWVAFGVSGSDQDLADEEYESLKRLVQHFTYDPQVNCSGDLSLVQRVCAFIAKDIDGIGCAALETYKNSDKDLPMLVSMLKDSEPGQGYLAFLLTLGVVVALAHSLDGSGRLSEVEMRALFTLGGYLGFDQSTVTEWIKMTAG